MDLSNFDIGKFIVPFTMPRWQLHRLMAAEDWKVEMMVITDYSQEWADNTFKQFADAAATTLMHNWDFVTECMARVKAMAARGDTQKQIDEWVTNLPDELLKTLEREQLALRYFGIYQPDYPGGPGALFPKLGA